MFASAVTQGERSGNCQVKPSLPFPSIPIHQMSALISKSPTVEVFYEDLLNLFQLTPDDVNSVLVNWGDQSSVDDWFPRGDDSEDSHSYRGGYYEVTLTLTLADGDRHEARVSVLARSECQEVELMIPVKDTPVPGTCR